MSSPLATPSDEAVLARVAKYEAWAAMLDATRGDYLRRMPLYRRAFLALVALGFACFAFGALPGVWGAFSATLISGCGYAMLKARITELEDEIAATCREVALLRAGHLPTTSTRPA